MTSTEIRTQIGARLFDLAVEWSSDHDFPGTQKDREARIKRMGRNRKQVIDGSRSVKAAREAVEVAAEEIRRERRSRFARRVNDGLGYCPVRWADWRGRFERRQPKSGDKARRADVLGSPKIATLPEPLGDVETRLHARTESMILDALASNYRIDSAGSEQVSLTRNPSDVRVYQFQWDDWDYYSKSTKHPKTVTETRITVPHDWLTRVWREGIAVQGRMLTIDAQRLEGAPEAISLYAATWVEQGRGYELRTVRGYLATGGIADSYHADNPEKAVAGVRRKIGLKKADAELRDLLERHSLDAIAATHPSLTVTVSDARATGSCEYGIRSWCERTGLPYAEGKAPLKDVYRAYREQPLPEARAAILHALRRNRRAVAKAA